MFFPEALYVPSPRDQQVTWLDPVLQRIESAVAAAVVDAEFRIPNGRCLVLKSLELQGTPGAAQNVATQQLFVFNNVNTPVNLKEIQTALAAGTVGALDWQGEIILPPEWTVQGRVNYNAGAAINTTRLSLIGILIPVGNIQRL